jgi:hypothetical protein
MGQTFLEFGRVPGSGLHSPLAEFCLNLAGAPGIAWDPRTPGAQFVQCKLLVSQSEW